MAMGQWMRRVNQFVDHQSVGGLLLLACAALALVLSNSQWGDVYHQFLALKGGVSLSGSGVQWSLYKPLLIWVNDLWMAIFFLLVGLEVKRELLEGELASRSQAVLPAAAALGGMVVPALIYVSINWQDAVAMRGWAIPMATDIAFALGILVMLGDRIPAALKIFLTAVAIIDDLGAIVVIALFYTADLSWVMLASALLGVTAMVVMNRMGVTKVAAYIVVGALVWLCVLKSGVHATLAGVVTGFCIPMRDKQGYSPASDLEHSLHPWVVYLILPMFAFANAGVLLSSDLAQMFQQTLPLGIVAGLVVGKPLGVFLASAMMIRWGGALLPSQSTWVQFFGVSILCGVGFTMSLFIGSLAFEGLDAAYQQQVKIGVMAGSLISALLGVAALLLGSRRPSL